MSQGEVCRSQLFRSAGSLSYNRSCLPSGHGYFVAKILSAVWDHVNVWLSHNNTSHSKERYVSSDGIRSLFLLWYKWGTVTSKGHDCLGPSIWVLAPAHSRRQCWMGGCRVGPSCEGDPGVLSPAPRGCYPRKICFQNRAFWCHECQKSWPLLVRKMVLWNAKNCYCMDDGLPAGAHQGYKGLQPGYWYNPGTIISLVQLWRQKLWRCRPTNLEQSAAFWELNILWAA